MTIQLTPFNDCNKPHMACGIGMYRGYAVVVSPNLPKVHTGDELIWVYPNILYCALYWLVTGKKHPPRFKPGNKIEEDQIFLMQGKLFMSPALWEELRTIKRA